MHTTEVAYFWGLIALHDRRQTLMYAEAVPCHLHGMGWW